MGAVRGSLAARMGGASLLRNKKVLLRHVHDAMKTGVRFLVEGLLASPCRRRGGSPRAARRGGLRDGFRGPFGFSGDLIGRRKIHYAT